MDKDPKNSIEAALAALTLKSQPRGPRTIKRLETRFDSSAPRKERRERNRQRQAGQQRGRRRHGRPGGR